MFKISRLGIVLVLLAASLIGLAVPLRAQSIAEMAGQMIVRGFSGSSLEAKSVQAALEDVRSGRIGGVMYLKPNVSSAKNVRAMNDAFLGAAEPKPLITIDQEGGLVERLTKAIGFKEVPSAKDVARSYSAAQAQALYAEMAQGVAGLGFNVNFGPVVDLDVNPNNPVIGGFGRSYGASPDLVSEYGGAFIKAHHDHRILTALKHFPGHGSSEADSHVGFTDVSTTWSNTELLPFQHLIDAGEADLVMIGHLFANLGQGDSATLPASLSHVWTTQVLRQMLGFEGVVISDDMEMGALRENYGFEEAIILAVRAGTDILLFANTVDARSSLDEEVVAVLEAEARRDPAFAQRIAQSYARIMKLKSRL